MFQIEKLEQEISIEGILNLQKKYAIIQSTIEVYYSDDELMYDVFTVDDDTQETYNYYLFGGIYDDFKEFKEFVQNEGLETWKEILGDNYKKEGIYNIRFLLRITRDGDGFRQWSYYDYESSDCVLYLGTRPEYEKELIGWRSLHNGAFDLFNL